MEGRKREKWWGGGGFPAELLRNIGMKIPVQSWPANEELEQPGEASGKDGGLELPMGYGGVGVVSPLGFLGCVGVRAEGISVGSLQLAWND